MAIRYNKLWKLLIKKDLLTMANVTSTTMAKLDMNKSHVRNKVRGVTSNAELDRIFEEDAVSEE